MNAEDWIHSYLNERQSAGRLRKDQIPPEAVLDFASNDYLGLANHPDLISAMQRALDQYGTGSGASRLITGTSPIHHALENAVAEFKGYPSALTFGSGFAANTGIIPALLGRKDHIYADKLIHASLLDGASLSGARLHRFPHNDIQALADQLAGHPSDTRALIITESVFSMDGDLAPLSEICNLATQHSAMLYVDEAHATGLFGPCGSGRVSELGLQEQVTLTMGTFSKALGSYGAYACCSEAMRTYLVNAARSFIYSTAVPAPVAAASLAAIDFLKANPESGHTVLAQARQIRSYFHEAGLDTLNSESAIIPVLIGDSEETIRIADAARQAGVFVGAIRPPTVPEGTARLRFTVSAKHDSETCLQAAECIVREFPVEKRA